LTRERTSLDRAQGVGARSRIGCRHAPPTTGAAHGNEARQDRAFALFNAGGKVRAVDDSCVRCGTSLAAGSLAGDDLRCPGCGWHYDVATGCVAGVPGLCIDTFAVSVADSDVMLATESPPG